MDYVSGMMRRLFCLLVATVLLAVQATRGATLGTEPLSVADPLETEDAALPEEALPGTAGFEAWESPPPTSPAPRARRRPATEARSRRLAPRDLATLRARLLAPRIAQGRFDDPPGRAA